MLVGDITMSGEIAERIIEKLKSSRNKMGLTQAQVAHDLGVKTNTYANWEQGRAEPSIDMIYKICKYFGESFDEWLNVEKKPYIEAAYEGKLEDLPDDDRQEVGDFIEFKHQKWLKEHGKS